MALSIESKNLEKIRDLVLQSSLSLADQNELIEAFSKATDSDLENVANLFTDDNSWIERMSKNYKAKLSALSSGNSSAWQNILREEESQLGKVEG